MYLSRLTLNPRHRRAQREMANPYELHRTLMRCFPDGLDREQERVLFRVETEPPSALPRATVLLQSVLEPMWAWLEDNGARGYLLRPPETKPFDLHLAPGQVLAFRLRANPTEKHWYADKDKPDGEKRPHRDPLYREEDQRAWIERKGEQGGFCVLRVAVAPEGNNLAWQSVQTGPRRKLTLFAVQFDGLLQVTDPDRLRETVRQGIGSGKGFGFGLLSLARPA